MAKNSFYLKWLIALLVIVALLILVYFSHLPDKEDEVPEQVEDIEWQDIDRVQIVADEEIYIARQEDSYQLFKGGSIYQVDAGKVHSLFETFNNFKEGEREPVNFEEWSKGQPDTGAIVLKLYHNTEEVLNLYILPGDQSTYYRYLEGNEIYSTQTISKEQFQWLDSLRE